MDRISVRQALPQLMKSGLKLPYGVWPVGNYDAHPDDFDKATWLAYAWNPPTGYDEQDPDGSPKPSWAEMLLALRELLEVDVYVNRAIRAMEEGPRLDWPKTSPTEVRRQMTDLSPINHGGDDIYVGQGLDHMTGLIQLAADADLAGRKLPHIVMRNASQNRVSIHTQGQVRRILGPIAKRENTVESAHNILVERFQGLLTTAQDMAEQLDTRAAAAGGRERPRRKLRRAA